MKRGLAIAALLLATLLGATEKAGPELQRERKTSSQREISVKPLFLYSARGRRDPFAYDISYNNSAEAVSRDFTIAELKLVGFLGDNETKTALFYNPFRRCSYRFRQGQLIGPEGTAVPNIKGAFMHDRQVSLVQGEANMMYQLSSNSKVQSLKATIAHDRKELQR